MAARKNMKSCNGEEVKRLQRIAGNTGGHEMINWNNLDKSASFKEVEAAKKVDLKDWKFIFVGPIEPSFKQKIDEFNAECPEKRRSVIFAGMVVDRRVLAEYYKRASVFVLSSENESFGLVLVESLLFQNFIRKIIFAFIRQRQKLTGGRIVHVDINFFVGFFALIQKESAVYFQFLEFAVFEDVLEFLAQFPEFGIETNKLVVLIFPVETSSAEWIAMTFRAVFVAVIQARYAWHSILQNSRHFQLLNGNFLLLGC